MSMIRIPASRAALYPTLRHYASHMLGEAAYQRRQDLGLSVAEAAALSGLALSQWMALKEGAWIPEDDSPELQPIAETLEVDEFDVLLWAAISRHNRDLLAAA